MSQTNYRGTMADVSVPQVLYLSVVTKDLLVWDLRGQVTEVIIVREEFRRTEISVDDFLLEIK